MRELLIPVEGEAAPLSLCFAPHSQALNRFTASNLAMQMAPNSSDLALPSWSGTWARGITRTPATAYMQWRKLRCTQTHLAPPA